MQGRCVIPKVCGPTPLAPVCALVLLLLVHATELAQQAGQGALLPPQDLQHAGQDCVSDAVDLDRACGQGQANHQAVLLYESRSMQCRTCVYATIRQPWAWGRREDILGCAWHPLTRLACQRRPRQCATDWKVQRLEG